MKRTHTFQDDSLRNRIPYTPQQNLVFVNVRPPVRTLLYCSNKACVLALISAGSRQLFRVQVVGKAALPLPALRPSRWAQGSGSV